MVGCVFDSNVAVGMGGAVVVDYEVNLTMRDCLVTGNTASSGGGVCFAAGGGTIDDCTITGNTAEFGGGIVFLSTNNVYVLDSRITWGEAVYQGGGVYASDSSFLLDDCTIANNWAGEDGGAGWLLTSAGVVRRSSVVGNSADGTAGGFFVDTSTLVATSGEFLNNGTAVHVHSLTRNNVDARYNWWGDSSGPFHGSLNPGGGGDEVSDSVWFDPWSVVSGVEVGEDVLSLAAPFPNPSREGSAIAFSLPAPSDVRLTVHDVAGRVVAVLVDGALPPGRHSATWDGRDSRKVQVAQGVYFFRLESGGEMLTRSGVVLR